MIIGHNLQPPTKRSLIPSTPSTMAPSPQENIPDPRPQSTNIPVQPISNNPNESKAIIIAGLLGGIVVLILILGAVYAIRPRAQRTRDIKTWFTFTTPSAPKPKKLGSSSGSIGKRGSDPPEIAYPTRQESKYYQAQKTRITPISYAPPQPIVSQNGGPIVPGLSIENPTITTINGGSGGAGVHITGGGGGGHSYSPRGAGSMSPELMAISSGYPSNQPYRTSNDSDEDDPRMLDPYLAEPSSPERSYYRPGNDAFRPSRLSSVEESTGEIGGVNGYASRYQQNRYGQTRR